MQSVSLAASNFALDSVIHDGIKDDYIYVDTNGQETAVSQAGNDSRKISYKEQTGAAAVDKRRNNNEL